MISPAFPASAALPRPRIRPSAALGFALVHVAALGVFFLGFSWTSLALCLGSYYLRMFAITAGFHRYFSHRSYRMGRVPQFVMAFLGQTAAQKGVLWWAAHHRHHHRFSDEPQDIHSPLQRGFWWSHMGWILAEDYEETNYQAIGDFAKFPELRWLNENMFLATMAYALGLFFAFGWTGLFWGYFLSTVLLWHGTFTINSVMHVFGRRVYATTDDSRNSLLLSLVTLGEGWHNNHHHFPATAKSGFRWWEVDATYYVLAGLSRLGIVRDLRGVPENVKAETIARQEAEGALARLDAAYQGAVAGWHERVESLSLRWDAMRDAARAKAHHAVADLEESRRHAAERLEALKRDYAQLADSLGRKRAAARARLERELHALRAEIARTYAQLAETLARLLETAEGGLVPAGA